MAHGVAMLAYAHNSPNPPSPPACYAKVPQRPSGPIGKRARDQRGALRYATRPARAVQHGGAIIRCVADAGARARARTTRGTLSRVPRARP